MNSFEYVSMIILFVALTAFSIWFKAVADEKDTLTKESIESRLLTLEAKVQKLTNHP